MNPARRPQDALRQRRDGMNLITINVSVQPISFYIRIRNAQLQPGTTAYSARRSSAVAGQKSMPIPVFTGTSLPLRKQGVLRL